MNAAMSGINTTPTLRRRAGVGMKAMPWPEAFVSALAYGTAIFIEGKSDDSVNADFAN